MDMLLSLFFWGLLITVMMRFGCGSHGHGHKTTRKKDEAMATPADHSSAYSVLEDRSALPEVHMLNNVPPVPAAMRWTPPEKDTDPVCGKTVLPASAFPSVHDGWVYYFCSRECRERFEAAPEIYLAEQQAKQAEVSRQAAP